MGDENKVMGDENLQIQTALEYARIQNTKNNMRDMGKRNNGNVI